MKSKSSIVPLNEAANIYMVVDERGRTLGTGTREVCEVLANLVMQPVNPPVDNYRKGTRRNDDNVRSAIKI
jgi:hypothetical protein